MALRASLQLSFSQEVPLNDFLSFVGSLNGVAEFRLAELTFVDGDRGKEPSYTATRTVDVHDSTMGENHRELDIQFWPKGDFTCRFQGDDEIVEVAQKVAARAREHFAHLRCSVLPC